MGFVNFGFEKITKNLAVNQLIRGTGAVLLFLSGVYVGGGGWWMLIALLGVVLCVGVEYTGGVLDEKSIRAALSRARSNYECSPGRKPTPIQLGGIQAIRDVEDELFLEQSDGNA